VRSTTAPALPPLEQPRLRSSLAVAGAQEIGSSGFVAYAKWSARAGDIRLHSITRHMHGLMAGREARRAWRRVPVEGRGAGRRRCPKPYFGISGYSIKGIAA